MSQLNDSNSAAPAAEPSNEPVASQNDSIDFDSLPLEQVQAYLDTGALPQSEPSAADAQPEPASQPAAEPDPKEGEPAKAAAEPKSDEVPAAEVVDFKFTENADPETFEKESKDYLETVEITPQLQAILDNQAKTIEELRAVAVAPVDVPEPTPLDEMTNRFVEGLNQMARFKQDPQTGTFIPDTSKLIEVFQKDFPNEVDQLIVDLNTQPSKRNPNYTVFQEFLATYGGLDRQGMENLQTLLDNKGKLPTPTFVPEGIDARVAEAYWTSPQRTAIDSAIATFAQVMNDPLADATDKTQAQYNLNAWMQELNRAQNGIDADKQRQAADLQGKQNNQTALTNKANQAYFETATELTRQFQEKIIPSLSMFDETGAKIAAISMTSLVEAALSDDDFTSTRAQADLKAQGINFDFKKGRATLDKLWQTEYVIQQQTDMNWPERSIMLTREERGRVLKELRALETQLLGELTKRTVTSAAKTLQKKVAAAPKTPAVRPKAAAAATSSVDASKGVSYDDMSAEQLQSVLGEMRAQRRAQGLPA